MGDLKILIIEAQKGDLNAFGHLVRRFQNMVYGYAYGILDDFHLAEDVAQEVFLEMYRKLPELRNAEAFSVWLRSVVYKYCDRLTRRKQIEMVHLDGISDLISDGLGPDELVAKKEVQNQVAKIVQGLPEKERVVTLLFYMNAHSLKEVATFLEVPVSTVKNRLHTARRLLKERMVDMVDEGLKAFQLPDRFADVIVQMQFVLGKINPLERRIIALRDDQLCVKREELAQRLKKGEDRNDVKAEAFALVKEASRRVLGKAHCDVQLVAGLMMDAGWVAEVGVGEGKDLVCLLPAYMAVLEGKRVHVVVLDDELAQEAFEKVSDIFGLLDVSVGGIGQGVDNRTAYLCDITYGSYTAFAFDGVRDRIRKSDEPILQSRHDLAIVDEVDHVLIHEGRTPTIIAQKKEVNVDFYEQADRMACEWIAQQKNEMGVFFEQDAKYPYDVQMTSTGLDVIQGASDTDEIFHQVKQALRAYLCYQKDREYVVQNDRVVILESGTGQLRPGRRFSEGLHQALEVKEQVMVHPEIQTEGSLLIQDYFKLYDHLSGVTGTAKIHEDEFLARYGLTVGVVPTRASLNRVDFEDRVYKDTVTRDDAVVDAVVQYSQKFGRPVLIGVKGIEESRRLSDLLKMKQIDCCVLNAVAGEQAAQIVVHVGHVGRVTIATEVIGRGTEIQLGEEALGLGGLHVVGYGRHLSRVYDDQLKACAGQQGQPGSSQFFLCRDDELIQGVWEDVDVKDQKTLEEVGVVENKRVTEMIARAQENVVQRQFALRKKLDDLGAP